MPQEPLLKVDNIDVFYGGLQALCGVSLTVAPGEVVAIIGANGAGKSTLLGSIAGINHPKKGTIEFSGRTISSMEPYDIVSLGVCLVPEAGRTFPNMTVAENLNIGSYNGKARKKKAQNLQLVYEHLPRLKERHNQLAKTLSGGERQMLAIGRGLMSDPQLMLFDELSLGLSPIIINELYRVIREIRQRGITVMLVEQNVRRSLKEADRAYILETGQVKLHGRAADLRQDAKVKEAYFGA